MSKLFVPTLLCGFICLSLFSCGESSTTTETDTDTTSTMDTSAMVSAPVSYIDTTRENVVFVRYKVSDYQKWSAAYESRDSMRAANGIRNYLIGRGVQDSNSILVIVKADDIEKAKAFSKDPALSSAMKKGFVSGTPKYMFASVVYQDKSPTMSDLRSINFFKVKSWNQWRTSFESSRKMREETGVTDKAYGHDVDDSSKVFVAVGINDSTRAANFFKSDTLKQRRADAGVIGEVDQLMYRVVKKY